MEDRHRASFERFAERVYEEVEGVKEVRLFGSVARGSHGRYSDVDILIVVRDLSLHIPIENIAFEVALEHSVSITPIIITQERWKKQTAFHQTVKEEGISYVKH